MDRFIGRIQQPAPVLEPPEKTRDLLIEIRDLLALLVGSNGGASRWHHAYLDLTAGVAQRIPFKDGRKSLSIYVSATGPTGTGNAYFGETDSVSTLTGMPILSGGEREFRHGQDLWVISDAGCRIIMSEEWEA